MTFQPAFALALLAVVVEFTLSANILAYWGVPYTDDGGSLFVKLHPGTYLAAMAMIARLWGDGYIVRCIASLIWRQRGLALFLGAILFCVLSAACLTGAGNLIALLDTFLSAGMIAVALCDITARETAILAHCVRSLFILNATIAIAEAACGGHLVPVVSAGPEQIADFRPTGLYDHPLTGAAATMLGLFSAPSAARRPWSARLYHTWLLIALLAFGGRVALALAILCAGIIFAIRLVRRALERKFMLSDLAPVLVVGLVAVPLVCVALSAGWAERLQTHFFWDPSAQARIAQFHLLELLSPEQLLFGCSRGDLLALIEPLRLSYGVDVIESFWLLLFATLGLFGFAVFLAGMAGLVAWLWRRVDIEGRLMLVSLLAAASASNSLGRKSTLLVITVASLLVRVRQPALPVAASSRAEETTHLVLVT